ncbi:MAG: nucleotide pyrophosphohydrolase [Deferribacteres bacterium]|nr:nucleotide pyrophosphohydrolase [Deferribacteres bacterium]
MVSADLKRKLLEFRRERDWEKFHRPKDLAVSLVIEAAELLEHFQWKTDKEVADMLQGESAEGVAEEIADIAIYLTYLCHDLNLDIEEIVAGKLERNREKYPAHMVRGSAKKYNEYDNLS